MIRDVAPILGSGALFRPPLGTRFQSLFADEPFKRSNATLIFLDEIGRLRILIKSAFLILADQTLLRTWLPCSR
ncbi:hypothetical protein A9K71_26430 [Mesorhizobium sp. WSM3873]|nr:hypothetical protein A9K71_26430 [Mesorhizobium sp. WSM3873]